MENKNAQTAVEKIEIPENVKFCGHNCADGCIYWVPQKRDEHGRQYCSHYRSHYYPSDRQGCLSYKD